MTKIFTLAASLRKDSCNKKLIRLADKIIQSQNKNLSVDSAEFSEFDMPLYDGDIETNQGIPAGAMKFIYRITKADGLIIASPEYNFSTPGTLKNLIDWTSRTKPVPWKYKPILLLAASPSPTGGHRGLLQTRIPLVCCGAHIFPKTFSLPDAENAFDDKENFKDKKYNEKLQMLINDYLNFVGSLIS